LSPISATSHYGTTLIANQKYLMVTSSNIKLTIGVEQNGYACTAEELDEKIAKLKKTSWSNQTNQP